MQSRNFLLSMLAAAGSVPAQTLLVPVPAAFDAVDAPSVGFVAGAHMRMREQYLFDQRLLTALAGKTLEAITFRRDAVQAQALTAGSSQLEVVLSTTNARVDAPSPSFASNHGNDRIKVFSGQIAIPASPGAGANRWGQDQVISVAFDKGFAYQGGTLCVEISGTPVTGQEASYWPFDYAWQAPGGGISVHGAACGPIAAIPLSVLDVDKSCLLPGASWPVMNRGPIGSLGLLLIAAPGATAGLDLGLIGAPGCSLVVTAPALSVSFVHDRVPPVSTPTPFAFGSVTLQVPGDQALLGGRIAMQSATIELAPPFTNTAHLTTSELLHVDLGSTPMSLGQSVVSSGGLEAVQPFPGEGAVITNRGPVVRFRAR
jgi:hypothetical protein